MINEDCIFCKLANGIFDTNKIYEDDLFAVILDVSPATEGHALILPKNHVANVFEIDEDTLGKAMILAKKIATRMKEVLGCDGINIIQNNGEVAGQTVMHYHLHVIPRYKDDKQNILWEPGETSDEALKEICRKLSF